MAAQSTSAMSVARPRPSQARADPPALQVDYSATPEELQELFASCGTVNRITILCDKFRNPKGWAVPLTPRPRVPHPASTTRTKARAAVRRYAYIEFAETEAIEPAVALSETEFKGRAIKVRHLAAVLSAY